METVLNISLYIIGGTLAFRIIRFLSTPILRKSGFYRYYSSMFFTMPLFYKYHEIHLGTSWDFFRMQKVNPRTIMIKLAEGLLNLIDSIEKGKTDGKIIYKGNTHYLNEKTARIFGFNVRNMNLFETIMFFISFFEHLLLSSLSHRKFHIIKLEKVKIVTIRAEKLIQYKPLLTKYLNRIKNSNINKAA